MWSKERHQKILAILKAQHQISTDLLADDFGVSRETIRRDLIELEGEGQVKRVHGGAVLPQPVAEESFKKRMSSNQREKKAIARRAVALIKPGECVFMDAGTTTSIFARELARIPDVSVITNSIDIAMTIQRSEHHLDVLLLGGRVVSDVPGTYGELTMAEISRFNVDVAVTSPVALHPEQGAANFDLHEAEVARAMIAHSTRLIMLADHSKLGATSRVQYCNTEQIDTLVTGADAATDVQDAFTRYGVKNIILAG
jgi:DeoR family transcriptional regulator, fructose operon transcriptional repressor